VSGKMENPLRSNAVHHTGEPLRVPQVSDVDNHIVQDVSYSPIGISLSQNEIDSMAESKEAPGKIGAHKARGARYEDIGHKEAPVISWVSVSAEDIAMTLSQFVGRAVPADLTDVH